MTPSERARQIDREEFAAECAAIRQRAFAKLRSQPTREPQVEMWIKRRTSSIIRRKRLSTGETNTQVGAHAHNANHYTAFGKTLTLKQWVAETGIQRSTILSRLKAGWTIEQALTLAPQAGIKPPGYVETSHSATGTGVGRRVRDLQPNLENSR